MQVYPICERFIDDTLNSGDKFYLGIEIGLKKDGFNRNIFLISYTPENLDFYGINREIVKDHSIYRILGKYGFNKNDKIKKAIQNVIDYRKRKILYL